MGFINSNCCGGLWDFMSITAAVPCGESAMGYGFDVNGTPTYDSVSAHSEVIYQWTIPALVNTSGAPHDFYRGIVTTQIDADPYGSVTRMTTTEIYYPFFENPNDTMQAALDGTTANLTTPDTDLRLTGGAAAAGAHSVIVVTQIVGNPLVYSGHEALYFLSQAENGGAPPTYTRDSVTHIYQGPPQPPTEDNRNVGFAVSKTIQYINLTSYSQILAQVANLLSQVSLIPGSLVHSREGDIYFDYQGVRGVYPAKGNLIPAGSVYDNAGNCTIAWSGKPTNQLLCMQAGANETWTAPQDWVADGIDDIISSPASTDGIGDTIVGSGRWPYMWHDGSNHAGVSGDDVPDSTLYTTVFAPNISEKTSRWDDTHFEINAPDCFNFVLKPGVSSITIAGGLPATMAHWTDAGGGATRNKGDWVKSTAGDCYQCTTAGISGASEPSWNTALNAVTSDGDIPTGAIWTRLNVPVTAIITPTHVNSFFVFPIKSGIVITCMANAVPIVPAINSTDEAYTDEADQPGSTYGNQGYILAESRVRIPPKPDVAGATDPTGFGRIGYSGAPPQLNLLNRSITGFVAGSEGVANNSVDTEFKLLTPGEFIFVPGNGGAGAANGMGWLWFSPLPTPPSAPPPAAGSGQAGSGTTA